MTELALYKSFVADSSRWASFAHRPGDIVISTPSKSGTTWTQMLVALLVFDGPDFPKPVNEMSLWLDMLIRPLEETVAVFEAQTHRRFIKTHTPLDGLPMRDDVTYLVVGRDPRDVIVSGHHHRANLDRDRFIGMRIAASGEPDPEEGGGERWPEDLLGQFRLCIAQEQGNDSTAWHVSHVLHHLQTGWDRRDQPNVHLFHYADLSRDLPGELVRLGDALGIDVSRDRAEELAAEASFGAMRDRAASYAPDAHKDIWQDARGFFRSGTSGQWRDVLVGDDLALYEALVAKLVPDDLARWAHHGWLD